VQPIILNFVTTNNGEERVEIKVSDGQTFYQLWASIDQSPPQFDLREWAQSPYVGELDHWTKQWRIDATELQDGTTSVLVLSLPPFQLFSPSGSLHSKRVFVIKGAVLRV
jgi:hypothetical protein